MNQAGGLHGGNGGESTESCGCCFGDAAQGAGPGLVASVGPPMPETEQGWEPAREELLGTGIDMPRRGRPRSCVGEAFLPGLDGDRSFIYSAHGLSLPTLPKRFHLGHGHLPAKLGLARAALWSGQTAPGDGAGLARHLSDGLPRWVRPELRLAPGLTGQRPQGPGTALCTTPQQHRLRHPHQALLLAQLGQGAGGEGRRRRGVLHSGGASLEGKRGSWASFPLHLVPLWLDGDAKWQALRARLGHFMPVWRS